MALGTRRRARSSSRKRRAPRKRVTAVLTQVKSAKRKRNPAWRRRAINAMALTPTMRAACKTDRQTALETGSLSTRTLYAKLINRISVATSFGTTGIAPNMRLRPIVNLRGWKINLGIINITPTCPLWFHYAIVTPKTEANADGFDTGNFFRGYEVSRDFGMGSGAYGSVINTAPINADRFHILFHKRWYIPKQESGLPDGIWNGGDYRSANYRIKEFYVPFKKPIAFDDDALYPSGATHHTKPETPIWAVYWVGVPMETAPAEPITNVIGFDHDVVAFFKEPKS